MNKKLNEKRESEVLWKKTFISEAKEVLKKMRIKSSNVALFVNECLSWKPDCAKAIIDVFRVRNCKHGLQENLELYLNIALFEYNQIDRKQKIFRLAKAAGMNFEEILEMHEALNDPNEAANSKYVELAELVEAYDEDDALEAVKEFIADKNKKRRKKKTT